MPLENRKSLVAAVSEWETQIQLFHMRDERIRFELTAEPYIEKA
jgi:hypothetical protein